MARIQPYWYRVEIIRYLKQVLSAYPGEILPPDNYLNSNTLYTGIIFKKHSLQNSFFTTVFNELKASGISGIRTAKDLRKYDGLLIYVPVNKRNAAIATEK